MNCPVYQLGHFMATTDEPQTIQKQNYVLQLYDEPETYNILYHKFSSIYCVPEDYVPYQMSVMNIFSNQNTGHFIMFSMITNMYNKKTKGPTLMDLLTATGKLEKFFLTRDVQCVYHG